jgi:hypothetical protein
LTGSKIRIRFNDGDMLIDDSESRGHVFSGFHADHETDWEEIVLDDRRDEPLEVQLVKQIRDIAAEWEAIAQAVENDVKRKQQIRFPDQLFQSTIAIEVAWSTFSQ